MGLTSAAKSSWSWAVLPDEGVDCPLPADALVGLLGTLQKDVPDHCVTALRRTPHSNDYLVAAGDRVPGRLRPLDPAVVRHGVMIVIMTARARVLPVGTVPPRSSESSISSQRQKT